MQSFSKRSGISHFEDFIYTFSSKFLRCILVTQMLGFQQIVVSPELLEEFSQKCRRKDKRVTVRCFLLQLGYNPKLCNVAIDGQMVYEFESIYLKSNQQIAIIPQVAGG